MKVERSTIAKWENNRHMPDPAMIIQLTKCLGTDANTLFQLAAQIDERPDVILVDDSRAILSDGLAVVEEVMPSARITGFLRPGEAIEYALEHPIALALLDIELGTASGLDLCRELLQIQPHINVVYLTAYCDYSFDAWDTGACGFMLKPITPESLQAQLSRLRYPFPTEG